MQLQTLQNHLQPQPPLATDPIRHQNVIVIFAPSITPPMLNTPCNIIADLTVTLIVAPIAVIVIMKIIATDVFPAHILTAIMLVIMIFCPAPSIKPMILTILTDLLTQAEKILLHLCTSPNYARIPLILVILTVMNILKILTQKVQTN